MPTIKLLGQEFGYPTTWHGAASVGFVAIAVSVITCVVAWSDPTIFRSLLRESNEESINQTRILEASLKSAHEKILALESHRNDSLEYGASALPPPSGPPDYSKWTSGAQGGGSAVSPLYSDDKIAAITSLSEQLEKSINKQRSITN